MRSKWYFVLLVNLTRLLGSVCEGSEKSGVIVGNEGFMWGIKHSILGKGSKFGQ